MIPAVGIADIQQAFDESRELQGLFANVNSVASHPGLVAALSILIAERHRIELPFLICSDEVRREALSLSVKSLPWRSPPEFNASTERMINESYFIDGFSTMDALLAISVQPSRIDAHWLHSKQRALSINQRDPIWCDYINDSFEKSGVVKTLIDAANDVDLAQIDKATASRWALVLAWFASGADRRVKDGATRSLTTIFRSCPEVLIDSVLAMKGIDDDDILERVLLAAYGALLANKNTLVMSELTELLLTDYSRGPAGFQNALIRDLIRCIGEMADHFGCLPAGLDPKLPSIRQRIAWKPALPSDAEMQHWKSGNGALYLAAHSCVDDDFNHYSIGCLGPWMHKMDKIEIGRWLVNHLVNEFGFESDHYDYYDTTMVRFHGGGRSKPVWAERIGKKYQWTALYRLASRLHDKYPRRADSWEPKPARKPLILQEERRLDPTIPNPAPANFSASRCWWLPAVIDLTATKSLSFKDWLAVRDDLPTLDSLLSTVSHGDQNWRTLHTGLEWSEYDSDALQDTPYRSTWIQLRGFLVPERQFDKALSALLGRNYFNKWLPEGGGWLHCFLGEYPWATVFNTEPDSYMGAGTKLRDTDITLIHAANDINCEWAYDGTLASSIDIKVPAKQLFKQADLQWNGIDGYCDLTGRTVFRDPHCSEGGKPAMIADADDLPVRLKRLGYRVIWTLLGEKWILGGQHTERLPHFTYSQLAWLAEDGAIKVGERRFFEDYNLDTGPAPASLRPTSKPRIEFTHNSIRINGGS